jgi:hypothetical protein
MRNKIMHARMFKGAFAAALLLAGFASNPTQAADYRQPVYQESYSPPPQPCCQQPVYQPPVYQPSPCCGGCNRGLFTNMTTPCSYGSTYAPQYQQYPQYQEYPQYQSELQYQEYPQEQVYPQYQQYRSQSYRHAPRVAVRAVVHAPRRMPAGSHCSYVKGRWTCR